VVGESDEHRKDADDPQPERCESGAAGSVVLAPGARFHVDGGLELVGPAGTVVDVLPKSTVGGVVEPGTAWKSGRRSNPNTPATTLRGNCRTERL
jgi:hypothetical protein